MGLAFNVEVRLCSVPIPHLQLFFFFFYLSAQHFGVREWRCCIFHMETVTHLCFGKEYSMMTTFLWVFTTPYFHMSGGQGARAQGRKETHRLGRACLSASPR